MTGLLPLLILACMLVSWWWSRRRTAKLAAVAGADLLPASRQNTELACPDPEVQAVLAAVERGHWQPAAQALASAGTDWERRSYLVGVIAKQAATDDSWLRAWQTAKPESADAAVVQADARVALAWRIRGGGWAKDTTVAQFGGFHQVLDQARADFTRAQMLAGPDDPTPYLLQIPVLKGLSAPHEAMRELWGKVIVRAPYHFGAHGYALQYWCAKWHGSAEHARAFAAQAAHAAPAGSLLTMFPLLAWYEHHDDDAPADAYSWPEVTALIDAALADVAAAPPGHPRVAEVRHLLAYFLTKAGRHHEALAQFRQVDGYVNAAPWRYYEPPAEYYCSVRNKALNGAVRDR